MSEGHKDDGVWDIHADKKAKCAELLTARQEILAQLEATPAVRCYRFALAAIGGHELVSQNDAKRLLERMEGYPDVKMYIEMKQVRIDQSY